MPAMKMEALLHLNRHRTCKIMHYALLPFLYKSTLDLSNALLLSLQFRYEPRRAVPVPLITQLPGVPPLASLLSYM